MTTDVGLTKGACTLWQEELLLDYTIEVEDKEFKVHKVVMASVSDYFKAMLTGGMVESQTDRVRLEGLDPLIVSDMIEFIYTGKFGSTKASPEELLACAVYLQIPAAIETCTELLLNEVNDQNCLDTLHTFDTNHIEDGIEKTIHYIKSHFDSVVEACFSNLSYDGFRELLYFCQKSEFVRFNSINKWAQVDHENRKQFLNDLMSRVRFALMTPEQLETIREMGIYTDSDHPWCDLVEKAEQYHQLPPHQKVLDNSNQSRVRRDPEPICLIRDNASSNILLQYKTSKYLDTHIPPALDHGTSRCLVVNNFLIVCEDFDRDPSAPLGWHLFNPRTLTWSKMSNMVTSRQFFAVVHHKNHLYALGGETDKEATDVIERYDFETNTWEVISTKLPIALAQHDACVIGDSIYVIDKSQTRLDYLDLSTNTWYSRAPVPQVTRRKVHMMELLGEEVLFVIDDEFVMHYYSPSSDQWSVSDCLPHVRSDKAQFFSDLKVLVDRNILFFHKPSHHDLNKGFLMLTMEKNGEMIPEVHCNQYAKDLKRVKHVYLTELLSIQSDAWRNHMNPFSDIFFRIPRRQSTSSSDDSDDHSVDDY